MTAKSTRDMLNYLEEIHAAAEKMREPLREALSGEVRESLTRVVQGVAGNRLAADTHDRLLAAEKAIGDLINELQKTTGNAASTVISARAACSRSRASVAEVLLR